MNCGKIISDAWKILWKYKILWIFGFIAGLWGSNIQGSTLTYEGNESIAMNIPQVLRPSFEFLQRVSFESENGLLFFLLLIVLVVAIIFYFIGTYGRIGLLKGVIQAKYEKPEKLSFRQIHDQIKPVFWRVIKLDILVLAAGLLLGGCWLSLAVINGIGASDMDVTSIWVFVITYSVLIVSGSVYVLQAEIALVIENYTIRRSFRKAWDVIRGNFSRYLLTMIVLAVFGAAFNTLIGLPFYLSNKTFFEEFLVNSTAANFGEAVKEWFLSPWRWLLILYWPVGDVLLAVYTAFIYSVWLLTYLGAAKYKYRRSAEKTDTLNLDESQIESDLETL